MGLITAMAPSNIELLRSQGMVAVKPVISWLLTAVFVQTGLIRKVGRLVRLTGLCEKSKEEPQMSEKLWQCSHSNVYPCCCGTRVLLPTVVTKYRKKGQCETRLKGKL
jgi:hypothetical protein